MDRIAPASADSCKTFRQDDTKSPNNRLPKATASAGQPGSFLCGYGRFTPQWLQRFHSPCWLVACLSFGSIAHGFVTNGMVPISLSTLERRFRLSSTESGLFASVYDIAVLLPLAIVCHFGAFQHKGRWLGGGLIILATGAIVVSLTHFISSPDVPHPSQSGVTRCIGAGNANSCDDGSSNTQWYFLTILILGQICIGFGASPLYTIGVIYIDENVLQASSAVYLSWFNGINMLGPALGYIIGGLLLKIPGDLGRLSSDQLERSEYGAWWLGFLIGASLALLSALPLLAFARQLPGAAEARLHDEDQSHQTSGRAASFLTESNFRALPRQCWMLLHNAPLLCLVLLKSSEYFLLTGFVNFMPKAFQSMLSLSASASSLIAGGLIIPIGVLGNICGGYVVRRFNLKCAGMILLALVLHLVAIPFPMALLANYPSAQFLGLNGSCSSAACGIQCPQTYFPICADHSTYFSPCFAGCSSSAGSQYTNCSCVDSGVANVGICSAAGDCGWQKVLLLAAFVMMGLLTFTSAAPIQQAVLRCVSFRDRTLAIGLSWVAIRIFGAIPAPLIFGAAIDSTCRLWPFYCGRRHACAHYDTGEMGHWILGFSLTVKLVNVTLLSLAYKLYKAAPDVDSPDLASTQM